MTGTTQGLSQQDRTIRQAYLDPGAWEALTCETYFRGYILHPNYGLCH